MHSQGIGMRLRALLLTTAAVALASNSFAVQKQVETHAVAKAPGAAAAGIGQLYYLIPDTSNGQIQLIDPQSQPPRLASIVAAGVFPRQVLVMPNGRLAFVLNLNAAYISVVDLSIQKEIYRIRGIAAAGGALTPDGSRLIVSDRITGNLDVIDTATLQRTTPLANFLPVCSNLLVVGSKLYFMPRDAGPIGVVNLDSSQLGTIEGTTIFSTSPGHLALSADGRSVVAIGGGTAAVPAKVLTIDVATNTVVGTVTLPANTQSLTLAIRPIVGGNIQAYVSMGNMLGLLDVTAGQFVGDMTDVRIPASSSALQPDGTALALVAQGENLGSDNFSVANLDAEGGGVSGITTIFFSGSLASVTMAPVNLTPSSAAPVVDTVTPNVIVDNSVTTLVEIDGKNFSQDAVVRIGSADPIVPDTISQTKLTVTLPPFTPTGFHNVVVINRNLEQPPDSLIKYESGIWIDPQSDGEPGEMFFSNTSSYLGQWIVAVANFGDSSVSEIIGSSSYNRDINLADNPWGIAFSGIYTYFLTSQTRASVITSLDDFQETRLDGGVGYGDAIAVVPDPQTGLPVALAPSAVLEENSVVDWELNVIDANPISETVGGILRKIPANSGGPLSTANGFAASPNGKFAFSYFDELNPATGVAEGRLAVYDLTNDKATIVSASALELGSFVQAMQVSPDGKYLAVADFNSRHTIAILDISEPNNPVYTATINTEVFEGTYPSCCNMRFASDKLFVFDPGTMHLDVFNFLPASGDFSRIGGITVPGNPDPIFQGGLGVSSDGAYVFVAQYDEDSLAVFDAAKVAASDPAALLTRIKTGIAPVSVAVDAIPFSSLADLSLAMSHTGDPIIPGSDVTFSVGVANSGPNDGGETVFVEILPDGWTVKSISAPSGVTCQPVGTAVAECTFGDSFPVDATYNFTVVASTPASATGTVTAYAEFVNVSGISYDPNPSNNVVTDPVTFTVAGAPDLSISIVANPTHAAINNLVNYTATITNHGAATATYAFARLSVSSGNIVSSPECSLDGPAFCNFDELAPGQSVVVHVTAQMPDTVGAVTMTGTVNEEETDANTADNTATVTVTVGLGADLVLTPADRPVIIGGIPTYTVLLTNNGPDAAPNTVVTAELTRFQYVSATSSVGSCTYDGIRVTCPVGNLANGASASVNVSVIPPDSGWALSEFHAKSDTVDPFGENNFVRLGPSGGSVGNTKAGFNVLVDALDPVSGTPANFVFSSVTKPGLTSVTSAAASQPPAGYRFGNPARVFDLSTTASYAGAIQVTLQFAGTVFQHPNRVHLFHWENGVWVDRTLSVDALHGLVTGVTTSLSPFVLAEPLNSSPVANAGANVVLPGAATNGSHVTLNGSASSDADDDTLSYRWSGPFPEGGGTVTGVSPTVTLPVGNSTVTLVVNDGATDSVPANLTVVVSDFTISGPAGQVLLSRGQSTSFDVAIAPKFGAFDAAVALACGNLPGGVTCTISSPSVNPGTQGAKATVTLTAGLSAGLNASRTQVFALWFGTFPVFGLLAVGSLRPKNWRACVLLGVLLILIAGMAACGGGSMGSSASTKSSSSSTATITVMGTSGALQRSVNTPIIIQ